MKKWLFCIILIFSFLISPGQYNIPADMQENYCRAARVCEEQLRSYSSPEIQNYYTSYYDVKFYFLDLNVDDDTVYLSGSVTITAKAVETIDTLVFDFNSGMTVDTVYVNGIIQGFEHKNDFIKLQVSPVVTPGTMFTAKVIYHGTPPTGDFFSGITSGYSEKYGTHVTWTLSEPYAAKDWWPVKQALGDKADSVWVFLTTSAENMAGSQGLLTAVTPMPGGKLRYEWKSRYPIDYYLISFAVADYQEYKLYAYPEGMAEPVFIQNYIYDHPNCLADYKAGIDRTASFIELFSGLFGNYPFAAEKYGHCLAELGGGMEHQTMTTIGGFSFTLVAHELGHSWFGDYVTCATWNDIWINEGFATYCDYLAHSFLADPIYDSIWLKIRHDQVKSLPGGSVWVPNDQLGDVWRIFDGRLSYSKGALLLHMIRFELQDDDLFFEILKSYAAEYGHSVATGNDFREWLEMKSGKDFSGFFNQWYYGEGYPIFKIVWNQTNETLNIYSTQSTSTQVTTLFKMTLPFRVNFTDGTDTTLLFYQDDHQVAFSAPVAKSISQIELDPDQWVLHKLNSISVGIEDTDSPVYFSIGPNPAHERLNLYFPNFTGKKIEMSIIDLSGRIVLSQAISQSSNLVEIDHLCSGIYLVSVTDGEWMMNKKLVVE